MNRVISKAQWVPSGGLEMEENAELAIKEHKNVLVIAGPGAGKTELLAQKAGYLFQTNACKYPRKILAISFKADAAANLRERIDERYGLEYTKRFTSMTYDAFSKRILDQFYMALPDELRPQINYIVEDKAIIRKAFEKSGYKNMNQLKKRDLNIYFEQALSSTQLPLTDGSLISSVWKLLLKGFDSTPACLTFRMISKLARYIIATNPNILKGLRATYSHVFLDEFQDTTSLQYDLVKTCFKQSNSIVTAVGDNKQRIMVWAGARETVFLDFQKDFDAVTKTLIMNHRSAPRLVNLQRLMYNSLKEEEIDLKTSSKWDDDDGSIKLFRSADEKHEAQYITKDIVEKICKGIAIKDICILVKQMPENYTDDIVSELKGHGINARIEDDYQNLLKEFVVALILNTLTVAITRRSPTEWEYINSVMIDFRGLDSVADADSYYKEHKRLVSLLDEIKSKLDENTGKEIFDKIIWDILDYFDISLIKSIFPAYSQGDYLERLIEQFKKMLWEEFLRERDWTVSIENFLGFHSIPIMTIHKSKGLEYSAIYFIGLEDGAFWNFKNQREEDRCAFFVAISRAKEHLSFSFCSYREKTYDKVQSHRNINEFYDLLQMRGVASIINSE